jgi:hypothetical protein
MEEDILQQEKEEKDKASRIQTLREIYEKKSSLNATSNSSKGIMWSDDDPATTPAKSTYPQGPPSTNRGSNYRAAAKLAKQNKQATAQEEEMAAQTKQALA